MIYIFQPKTVKRFSMLRLRQTTVLLSAAVLGIPLHTEAEARPQSWLRATAPEQIILTTANTKEVQLIL
jgi:hypothetical protein